MAASEILFKPQANKSPVYAGFDNPFPVQIGMSNLTPFGEVQTAEFSPLIELDSSNGLSLIRRDTVTQTGTGSVTESGGGFLVSSGATASGTAELRTKERGRYQPGIVGVPGQAFQVTAAPTGDGDIRIGYFDDEDGAWLGRDSSGWYIQHRYSGTTASKVRQADWTGKDKLDGSGPSGVALADDRVFVARNPFVWYGGGPISFFVQTAKDDGTPVYAELHNIVGPKNEAIFGNPKLPVAANVDNGTEAETVSVKVYGRQFAVLGRYDPNRGEVVEERSGVTVTAASVEPLISIRKKSDRKSTTKSVKVRSAGVTSNRDGFIEIWLGATLSGSPSYGAFTYVPASETACERDIAAAGGLSIGSGMLLTAIPVTAGQRANVVFQGIQSLGQDLPEGVAATLAFRNIEATNDATVNCVFSVEEET